MPVTGRKYVHMPLPPPVRNARPFHSIPPPQVDLGVFVPTGGGRRRSLPTFDDVELDWLMDHVERLYDEHIEQQLEPYATRRFRRKDTA